MYVIVTFTLTLICSIIPVILYLTFCLWRPSKKPPEAMTVTTHKEIQSLLDPPHTDTTVLLRRRALPNARLVRAFGIHNSTFTSPELHVNRVFRKNALARLRALESLDKWHKLRRVIHGVVDFYLPNGPELGDYALYMQAIVFTTVLAAFFDYTAPFPDASEVRFVTEGINTLWIASKSPTFSHRSSPILMRINQYLHSWLPYEPADPFHENPLELLLPAYETLWRSVASAFPYIEGSTKHISPFLDFFENPTTVQFRASADTNMPSAHYIMQEVLRLHPPTKRIKRISDDPFPSPFWIRRLFSAVGFQCDSACNFTIAADIEALQRCSVWGPSPHDFDAMRHKASTEAQEQCFVPFGLGPLRCVASSVAPRLAGMIIAGLAKRGDVELTRGESLGDREGWGGWKISRRVGRKIAVTEVHE